MLSATTKVYGLAELAILFCYPKVWRNLGYALLCGTALLLLPAINTAFDNVLVLYREMFTMIASHHSDSDFIGILFARGLKSFLLPNYREVQIIVLALLGIAFFARYKRWKEFRFRVQALAVLSGFMILFSDCPETHTYIITFPFYAMAFWLQPRRTWLDWTLFWSLVINFCILPTDVLCPAWLHNYIHQTYWIDVYTYFFCWLRVIWWAVGPSNYDTFHPSRRVITICALLLFAIGVHAQNVPTTRTFIVKGIQFKMKYVEGGSFVMGALPNDTLANADEIRRKVSVSSYYIGETEVTQDLWEAIMGKNRAKHRGAKQPMEYVTYGMCKDFIAKLNLLTGQTFRLPTEAEWEYAARGGKKSKGYLYAGSNDIDDVAFSSSNPHTTHQQVGMLKPNELGLYDMSGNVWEWCEDWYQKTPGSKPSSNFHVIRGGGYDNNPEYCRITNRFMYDQRRRFRHVGFRLVLQIR